MMDTVEEGERIIKRKRKFIQEVKTQLTYIAADLQKKIAEEMDESQNVKKRRREERGTAEKKRLKLFDYNKTRRVRDVDAIVAKMKSTLSSELTAMVKFTVTLHSNTAAGAIKIDLSDVSEFKSIFVDGREPCSGGEGSGSAAEENRMGSEYDESAPPVFRSNKKSRVCRRSALCPE